MIFKSIKEEWPYTNDCIWVRWTEDGVHFKEDIMKEDKIMELNCLGIPEWRPLDPPEWASDAQKEIMLKIDGRE